MSRIPIVEDDRAILCGLRDNLEFESHRVLTATDGEAGYRALCLHTRYGKAAEVCESVVNAVRNHTRGQRQADDLTIIAARVTLTGSSSCAK